MIIRRIPLTAVLALAILPAAVLPAWAQGEPPRVAILDRGQEVANMAVNGHPWWHAFLSELRRRGYIEGQTISIERWSGRGLTRAEIEGPLAQRMVATRPDVIVVRGRNTIRSFAATTKTIPIVGIGSFGANLYETLARPGGNLTGLYVSGGNGIYAKQMQLLHDAAPAASRIALLVTLRGWERVLEGASTTSDAYREAAAQLGLRLAPVPIDEPITDASLRLALESMVGKGFDAVVVSPSQHILAYNATVSQMIASLRLPAITTFSEFARSGLLMTYAPDQVAAFTRLASFVDRILKGANPGELPIEQPTKFDFIVNLKTARALGLTLPPAIMIQATEFIE